MARVHLVCGSTGAGKTTYAAALAARIGGVRFSIDAWMSALFWMDSPRPLEPGWSMARVERCYGQIWSTARDVARAGVDVVLDLGFSTRESRTRFAQAAKVAELGVELHLVEASAEERWRRVERRNSQVGDADAQLPFAVDREMFDFVETLWEPPAADELAAFSGRVNGVSVWPTPSPLANAR